LPIFSFKILFPVKFRDDWLFLRKEKGRKEKGRKEERKKGKRKKEERREKENGHHNVMK
jgi:hypothetical protein